MVCTYLSSIIAQHSIQEPAGSGAGLNMGKYLWLLFLVWSEKGTYWGLFLVFMENIIDKSESTY